MPLLVPAALAASVELNPGDDVVALTASLGAGDEVVFNAGTYTLPEPVNWTGLGTVDAPIVLRIDAAGEVYWNGDPTALPTLRAMLQAEVARDPQAGVTLQIDASDEADYGAVARVLAAARNAEVQRIGFLRR